MPISAALYHTASAARRNKMTTATATAAAETCACARCGALVAVPDYRPAWIYYGLCMDCAA